MKFHITKEFTFYKDNFIDWTMKASEGEKEFETLEDAMEFAKKLWEKETNKKFRYSGELNEIQYMYTDGVLFIHFTVSNRHTPKTGETVLIRVREATMNKKIINKWLKDRRDFNPSFTWENLYKVIPDFNPDDEIEMIVLNLREFEIGIGAGLSNVELGIDDNASIEEYFDAYDELIKSELLEIEKEDNK